MKTTIKAMAGGFTAVCIAVTAIPINAEEINNAFSGTSLCIEHNPDSSCARSVTNGVAIPLKENGKKSNKAARTSVGQNALTAVTPDPLDPTTYCLIDDQPGLLFIYTISTAVATLPNGDLIVEALDPAETSTVCVNPLVGNFEATVHRNIIGGTGQYMGACGSEELNGTGVFLPPDTNFAVVGGTSVGEVFVGDDCP